MRNNLTEKHHISIESLKIILNAYQETSGEPLVKCRARAMYDVLTQIPIFIREGDLLAGNGASRPNCLEIDVANGIWNQFEIDALRADGYTFDEADEQILSRLNETTPPFSLNDGVGQVIDDDSPLMPFFTLGHGFVTVGDQPPRPSEQRVFGSGRPQPEPGSGAGLPPTMNGFCKAAFVPWSMNARKKSKKSDFSPAKTMPVVSI